MGQIIDDATYFIIGKDHIRRRYEVRIWNHWDRAKSYDMSRAEPLCMHCNIPAKANPHKNDYCAVCADLVCTKHKVSVCTPCYKRLN